jgi:glutamine amidotransferase
MPTGRPTGLEGRGENKATGRSLGRKAKIVPKSVSAEIKTLRSRSAFVKSVLSADNFPVLEQFLRHMNGAGTLNLIFSDGRHLYCYHDEHGYNGLYWTHRRAPFCRVSLRDEDWTADLDEEKSPDQQSYVIASKKLTDGEPWHEFRRGSLMVFRDGQIVHGG